MHNSAQDVPNYYLPDAHFCPCFLIVLLSIWTMPQTYLAHVFARDSSIIRNACTKMHMHHVATSLASHYSTANGRL